MVSDILPSLSLLWLYEIHNSPSKLKTNQFLKDRLHQKTKAVKLFLHSWNFPLMKGNVKNSVLRVTENAFRRCPDMIGQGNLVIIILMGSSISLKYV